MLAVSMWILIRIGRRFEGSILKNDMGRSTSHFVNRRATSPHTPAKLIGITATHLQDRPQPIAGTSFTYGLGALSNVGLLF